MYIKIIKNKIKKELKDTYINVSKSFAEEMSKVDGCVEAKVLVSLDEDDVVTNLEIWKSEEAFNKYDGSVFLKYKKDLKPCFISNTTETYYI